MCVGCEDTYRGALVVQRIRSQNHACSSPAQSPAIFPQHHRADLALAPRYRITLRRRMTCVRSQASGAREPRSALRFWYALATEWCGESCGGPQGRTDWLWAGVGSWMIFFKMDRGGSYGCATRGDRFWMGEAEDVAQEVREAHDVVRCVLIEGERSSGT